MTKSMTSGERPQPTNSDPKEQAIRKLIEKEFSTEFSRREIERLKKEQLQFIASSIARVRSNNSDEIRPAYLSLLSKLGSATQIQSGGELLKNLPSTGFIVATNHLAMPKVTRFYRHDLGEQTGDHQSLQQLPEEIEPFPIRHAAISATLGQLFNPHEVAIELPRPYNDIQFASGVIALPSTLGGRFQIMVDNISVLFSKENYPYVITYPESGTTGKRGGGGLYGIEQEDFHTGFIRLAKTLQQLFNRQIPIVTIGQIFHPENGFRTGILNPITVDNQITENEIKQTAANIQKNLSALVQQLRFGQ